MPLCLPRADLRNQLLLWAVCASKVQWAPLFPPYIHTSLCASIWCIFSVTALLWVWSLWSPLFVIPQQTQQKKKTNEELDQHTLIGWKIFCTQCVGHYTIQCFCSFCRNDIIVCHLQVIWWNNQMDGSCARFCVRSHTMCGWRHGPTLHAGKTIAFCLGCVWEMLQSAEPMEFKQKFATGGFLQFDNKSTESIVVLRKKGLACIFLDWKMRTFVLMQAKAIFCKIWKKIAS